MLLSDVFISYSRKDSTFVDRLNKALTSAKKDVWVDWEDIPFSSKWWDEISQAIEGATTFICILSPEYFNSKTCLDELVIADKNNKRKNKLIYIILIMHLTSASLRYHSTAAPCGSLTVPLMFPAVLDWACTPTNRPILSRSNDACIQDLIDIQYLLGVA